MGIFRLPDWIKNTCLKKWRFRTTSCTKLGEGVQARGAASANKEETNMERLKMQARSYACLRTVVVLSNFVAFPVNKHPIFFVCGVLFLRAGRTWVDRFGNLGSTPTGC